jgi:hypothetical protein
MHDTRSAARLMVVATGWAVVGLLVAGEPMGLLVGAPVAVAAIFRAFGRRDPSDWY